MKLPKNATLLIWVLLCVSAYGQSSNSPPDSLFENRLEPNILKAMIEIESTFGMDVDAAKALARQQKQAILANPNLHSSPNREVLLDTLQMFDDMALHAETGQALFNIPIKALRLKADAHLALLVACAQARVAKWNGQNKLATEFYNLAEDLVPQTHNNLLKTIAYSRILQHRIVFQEPEYHEEKLSADIALLAEYQDKANCLDGQITLDYLEVRANSKDDLSKYAAEVKKLFLLARENRRLEQASMLLGKIWYARLLQKDFERIKRIIEEQLSLAEKMNNPLVAMRRRQSLITHFNRNQNHESAMEAAKKAYEAPIFFSLPPYFQNRFIREIKIAALHTNNERYLDRMRKTELPYKQQIASYHQFRESERQAVFVVTNQRDVLREHIATTNKFKLLDSQLALRDKEIALKSAESQLLTEQITTKRIEAKRLSNLANAALDRANLWMWFVLLLATIILGALVNLFYRRNRNASGELEIQERNIDELSLKLARMRRMDSLGLMAGSIAHDFNNILVGVTGNAELIDLAQTTGKFNEEYVMERVSSIKVAASRAQKLAMQMLNYAGKQYIAQKTRDLNKIVSGYETILTSFSKKKHQVTINLSKTPLIAKVDETQIEQAVFNIVTNAMHASPAGGPVEIRTFTSCLNDVNSDNTLFGSRQTGGEFCCIEIEDDGIGIPAHQIEKIFEPYFSESGQGRGLGLAVVYGIIDSHDGLIRCESTYGQGTKFQLLLPVGDVDHEDSIDTYLPQKGPKVRQSHHGKHVLIIDDEIGVIDTCEQLLTHFGLKTKSVHIQGEAGFDLVLDALAEESFDCIMLDVVMPELNGTQILDALEEREIRTPVILMSGFSPERLDFYHKRISVEAILPKPFGIPELINAINQAMPETQEMTPTDLAAPSPDRPK